uniref:ELM2 domain-containing protein n=1 Tax=Panagrolaimus davidi TaxID=227884 RepID=A0A914QIN1_9BILA
MKHVCSTYGCKGNSKTWRRYPVITGPWYCNTCGLRLKRGCNGLQHQAAGDENGKSLKICSTYGCTGNSKTWRRYPAITGHWYCNACGLRLKRGGCGLQHQPAEDGDLLNAPDQYEDAGEAPGESEDAGEALAENEDAGEAPGQHEEAGEALAEYVDAGEALGDVVGNSVDGAENDVESEHKCAAKIPNFQGQTEAADDSDRDECVSTPEDFKFFSKCKIDDKIVLNSSNLMTDEILEKYLSACGTKFNGGTDSALAHLSANGYLIKEALEGIDNPDSIPIKRIHEDLGIWLENEMDAFVKYISNNYKRKNKYGRKQKNRFWIKGFQKKFPQKSPRNCLNFYYTLKSAGFSFKKKDKKVYGISKFLPKTECLNCVKQLWKSQSDQQVSNLCGLLKQLWKSQSDQQVSNLCGLCKLYFELYGKQRPNAKALPL